ncbi:cell division protein FtsL [Lactobacillus sp. S2-2]|uniref:cell division protein FtsL n=1 Tax=Lactobacillus sp. S2-2 TaxID=2692917 RepID=UPI001F0211D1|nr:cell division protein FtsL [Lactobacillus sp. S2-2]MCF6514851.1 cell division protein FtsL [Lactobacillus sp. S2-2]
MSNNALAKNLQQSYQSEYKEKSNQNLKSSLSPKPDSKLKVSFFEKTLISVGGLVIAFLMIITVSSKISLGDSQQQLQNINSSVVHVRNQNNNLSQENDELNSGVRLNKIAKKSGLSLNSKNIRNVNR